MLGRHYNNFFSRTNSSSRNKIANSRPIDYIKEIATDKDKEIIKEDQEITAEDSIYYLAVKRPTMYIANQNTSPINILLINNNNHKRDLKTEFNLI